MFKLIVKKILYFMIKDFVYLDLWLIDWFLFQDKQKKVRICLCAQSHAAVDELIRRFDRM